MSNELTFESERPAPLDALVALSRVPEERRECVEALNRRLGLLS